VLSPFDMLLALGLLARKTETVPQTVVAIFTPVILVGFGSVIQAAVQSLISPADSQQGMIYQFAGAPLQGRPHSRERRDPA
jgi:hypothetical protein